jgi:hypothetical protein
MFRFGTCDRLEGDTLGTLARPKLLAFSWQTARYLRYHVIRKAAATCRCLQLLPYGHLFHLSYQSLTSVWRRPERSLAACFPPDQLESMSHLRNDWRTGRQKVRCLRRERLDLR